MAKASGISERLKQIKEKAVSAIMQDEEIVEATAGQAKKKEAAPELDVSNNPVAKIMMDSKLARDEKIDALTAFLTPKSDDDKEVQARFAQFETYYAYLQKEGVQRDVEGLEQLINELKNALKPEVEKVVRDIVSVQKGVDESRKLLLVIREARIQGKTIEQISEAIRLNDKTIAEIQKIQKEIEECEQDKEHYTERLEYLNLQNEESKKGFVNRVARALLGPDAAITAAIAEGEGKREALEADIQNKNATIKTKEEQRNTALESGPLVILRTIDATEEGFSANIIQTAQSSLSLINGASSAVLRLSKRATYSGEQARAITSQISAAQIQQIIMKTAVHRAVENTDKISQTLREKLGTIDETLEAGTEGSNANALLQVERLEISQKNHALQSYQTDLNNTETSLDVNAAGNIEAQTRGEQFSALVQSQKDLLKSLGTEAIPVTVRALRMVLEQDVARQTSELAGSIGAITSKAREIGQDSLARLIETQDDMHNQEVKRMDETIQALAKAEELMLGHLEKSVEQGFQRREVMEDLRDGAENLSKIMETADQIRPETSNTVSDGNPAIPGAVNRKKDKNNARPQG